MARTNKYSSINYNHIYERNLTNHNNPSKQTSSSSSSSSSSSVASYSAISSPNAYKNHLSSSSSRTHGRMLVLTRPAAKPVSPVPNTSVSPSPHIPSSTQQSSQMHVSDQSRNRNEPDSDQISLRPLGRTGSAGPSSPILFHPEREKEIRSPKPNKFVPPHLRPGFAGKEERPGPEVFRGKEASPRVHHPALLQQQQQGFFASSDGGRPKSGGYERIRRGGGGESDLGLMNRPRSSGNRPNSSGWCSFRQRRMLS